MRVHLVRLFRTGQERLRLRRSSLLHQLLLKMLLLPLPTLLVVVARGQSGRVRKSRTGPRRLRRQ